jgi:hypothetical protein
MASPAVITWALGGSAATTAPTATLAATQADDILILISVNGGAASNAAPGGTYSGGAWTSVDAATWTTGAGQTMWSRCTGNHTGQTISVSTTNSGSVLVVTIRGAITSASPIDANKSGATLGAVAGGALTGFNTTVAETLVCYTGAVDDNQAASGPTKNAVAMTTFVAAPSSGGTDSQVWFASSDQASAGSTGNFDITNAAGTAEGKRVAAFAIIPPAVVPVIPEVVMAVNVP